MSKHTPGSWSVQLPADDSSRIRVVDERAMKFANHRIADLQYWTASQERGPSRDEALANARLIAAAPDLLAAAQAVLSNKRGEDDWLILAVHCIDLAAAVAKATGEEP